MEGREITYRDKTDSYLVPCVVGVILAAIAGMLLYNSQMQQNVRKRDEELCKDYPEMVEQFVLLVGDDQERMDQNDRRLSIGSG